MPAAASLPPLLRLRLPSTAAACFPPVSLEAPASGTDRCCPRSDLPATTAEGGGFGMDDAPPDWDARDQGGVWEVNVAPLKPAIPESLPTWAQDEQMQYNQQQQQYHLNAGTTPARGFGAAFGSTFSRAFAPIPGLGGDGGGYGGGYGGHRSFDQQMTDTNNRTDEAGRKPSLVSTNL